jgi:hypothetical protein
MTFASRAWRLPRGPAAAAGFAPDWEVCASWLLSLLARVMPGSGIRASAAGRACLRAW